MQVTPAFSEITEIKTASLNKLLFWSLAFHLIVLITFWNEKISTPMIAGKEISFTLLSNSEPDITKIKHLKTNISSETKRRENDIQEILASKPDIQQIAIIKPESIKDKKPVSSFQQTKSDRTSTSQPLAGKNTQLNPPTETAALLQASLGKQLSEYFNYPGLARKRGWQGQVKLRLRIEGNGNLSNIRLYKSSGYPSLDNAALKSLQRVARLPDASTWLHGMHYDIVVPVEYHLIDS